MSAAGWHLRRSRLLRNRRVGLMRYVEGQGLRLIVRRIEVRHVAVHRAQGWENFLHLAWRFLLESSAQWAEVSVDGVAVSAAGREHFLADLKAIRIRNTELPGGIQRSKISSQGFAVHVIPRVRRHRSAQDVNVLQNLGRELGVPAIHTPTHAAIT